MISFKGGAAFRDHVFARLCGNTSIAWPQGLIVPLLGVIRDVHPDEKELRLAVGAVPSCASSHCILLLLAVFFKLVGRQVSSNGLEYAPEAGSQVETRDAQTESTGASAFCLPALAPFYAWSAPGHPGDFLPLLSIIFMNCTP